MPTQALTKTAPVRVRAMRGPSMGILRVRSAENSHGGRRLFVQFLTGQSGVDVFSLMPTAVKPIDDRYEELIGKTADGRRMKGSYDTRTNSCTFELYPGWVTRTLNKIKSLFAK